MTAEVIDPVDVARQLFADYPPGFPYENFDVAELILPDGDDMGIPSDDDEGEEEEVETETGFGSVIVVDNLPVVPEEKYEKLVNVLKKVYGQIGTIREGGVYMPQDNNKVSKGFAFVEFSSPMEAQAARAQTDGYRLDKNHVFRVNMFDDFDKYSRVPEEFVPREAKPYEPVEGLYSWMMDKSARDQFAIRFGNQTSVMWNDGRRNRAEDAYSRANWTESYVQWSPMGDMLATVHRQGVAVWGGPTFKRLNRFEHHNVQLIEFSPAETYLFAYSSIEPSNPREKLTIKLDVFDVRHGTKVIRRFEGPMEDYAVGAAADRNGALKWPFMKWAGGKEDRYFAHLAKNMISVYEAPEMTMLHKKSIKLEGVQDFEWSPAEPLLAAYTVEQSNIPARIQLIKIPERTDVRQKNLFSVSDVQIYWHPQGDYLAVKVDRYTKTKKSTYTGFELFSIRERDIPMEVLELPNKAEKIVDFAWEPKGHRFCVVHGEGQRPNVSFYTMKDEKGKLGVKHLATLPNRPCNGIHWSPLGRNIVLSGLKTLNGQLEFYNVDEGEVLAAAEHFMATDVDWDPTGRYVATAVTSIHQMENGFNIWSWNGNLLYHVARDRFFQFSWRPRMPSLLPPEKEAEIAKNLKAYSKKYDEEDEALLMQADADVLQERERLLQEWKDWAESKKGYREELRAYYKEVYGPAADEPEYHMEAFSVEQVLDVKEEPYNSGL